jgi:hypothetical protein
MDQPHHHIAEVAEATQGRGGLAAFFSQQWFMPHGHCYLWKPGLVWLHVGSDTLIWPTSASPCSSTSW